VSSLLVTSLCQARRRAEAEATAHQRAKKEIWALNQTLQERLHDFETLLHVIPIGIAVTDDPASQRVWLNPALADLLRLPPDANAAMSPLAGASAPLRRYYCEGQEMSPDAPPLPFLGFFTSADEEQVAYMAALRRGERIIVEDVTQSALFRGTSGLDLMLAAGVRAIQCVPLISHTGQLLGMLITHYPAPHRPTDRERRMIDLLARQAADAIERTQVEEWLQQYALLLECSYEAMCIWDLEHGIIEWNQGCEHLYGIPKAEARGQMIHTLRQTRFPVPFAEYRRLLVRDGQWSGELRHTTRTGAEVLVASRHRLLETGGRRLVLQINHDITA
jgi:PAS domain S-box-containing protein